MVSAIIITHHIIPLLLVGVSGLASLLLLLLAVPQLCRLVVRDARVLRLESLGQTVDRVLHLESLARVLHRHQVHAQRHGQEVQHQRCDALLERRDAIR